MNKKDKKVMPTHFNIEEDSLFIQELNSKLDYEDGDYTAKYEQLAKDLNSVYAIRTKDYEFQFRKGLKELHVIPVLATGKTNSDKRKVYNTKFGGVIPRHLSFGLEGQQQKGLFDVQFDSKLNSDKLVVVKMIIEDEIYCKRGVLYDVMNHKGNLY